MKMTEYDMNRAQLRLSLFLGDMPEVEKTPSEIKREIKAAKKAQKKAEALQKQKDLVWNQLQRELKLTEKNSKMLKKVWRDMGVNAQLPALRENLENSWHSFDRVLDLKDHMISNLLDEIQEADDQYHFNMQAHAETIDGLLGLLYKRLQDLDSSFMKSKQKLCEDWIKESEEMKNNTDGTLKHLSMMKYALKQRHGDVVSYNKGELLAKLNDESHNWLDVISRLQSDLDLQLAQIWEDLIGTLKNYQDTTKDLRKEYAALHKKDESALNEINDMMDQAKSDFERIRKLKEKFTKSRHNWTVQADDVLHEKKYFMDCYMTLRKKLMRDRALDKRQVEILTANAIATNEYLKDILTKGRKVLSYAMLCRRYETQQEKVLPFPLEDNTMCVPDMFEDDEDKSLFQLSLMDGFWMRVGRAAALRREAHAVFEHLSRENRFLTTVLRDIATGRDREIVEAIDERRRKIPRKFRCFNCNCMSEVGHSCLDARNAREVSRMRQKNVDIERKEGELAEDCAKMTVTALIDRLTEEIPKKYTTKIAVIEAQHIYKRLSTK